MRLMPPFINDVAYAVTASAYVLIDGSRLVNANAVAAPPLSTVSISTPTSLVRESPTLVAALKPCTLPDAR